MYIYTHMKGQSVYVVSKLYDIIVLLYIGMGQFQDVYSYKYVCVYSTAGACNCKHTEYK